MYPRKTAKHRADPREFTGPKVVRAVTVMLDLKDDMTVTAIIGVMSLASRRYHFVRVPMASWWGAPASAVNEALVNVAKAAHLDAELNQLLR